MSRRDRERLEDMLEALERLRERVPTSRQALEADVMAQVWVLHHLRIVGEAARGVGETFRSAHPAVPWRAVVGLRTVLVHRYFDIDLDVVWNTLVHDLPGLEAALRAILASEQQSDD